MDRELSQALAGRILKDDAPEEVYHLPIASGRKETPG